MIRQDENGLKLISTFFQERIHISLYYETIWDPFITLTYDAKYIT